jgi:hypothetical protein
VKSVGTILRLEPRGGGRFFLIIPGERRHAIRLTREEAIELEGMLGSRRPAG